MSLTLTVTPEARKQLRELARWWSINRPASRTKVNVEFRRVTDRIRSNPYLGQLYSGDERYRTMPIKGTPYLVFYAIDEEAQAIDIDAVWSAQRGKGPELK